MIIFFRHPRKGAMIGVRVTRTVRSFGLASASPRPFGRLDIASLRERGSFIPTVGTP